MNSNSESQNSAEVDNHLILAIARAFQWQGELESGEHSLIQEIDTVLPSSGVTD